MTPAEAYHVLQLEPGAGRDQIVQGYAEQTRVLKEKRAKAPSPGQKAHIQQGLARLTAAHDVLIQREDAAAGAARRRRGANQSASAGSTDVEARVVTAADVDAAADRLPRRLNRHADGLFFALLATLAGGLVGAVVSLLLAEEAGRRALFVGVGLLVGLLPGILWWRATVQRLRRAEWIQVREALERGEILPLVWRRQALRLAAALLLLLGFGVGYQRWTRWPALALHDERAGVQAKGTGKPMSAAAESSSARDESNPEEPPADRERERGVAREPRPNVVAPIAIKSDDRSTPPPVALSRQVSVSAAGSAKQTASRESAVTPAQKREADAPASPKDAHRSRETQAVERRDPLAAHEGARSRDQATAFGKPRRAAQASTVPADVARAEAARASGGDPEEIRAGLGKAYHTWAEGLREAAQPGLALFALDQAKAAGLADEDLAALLRKEFTEANALTVWLTPPQIIEEKAEVEPAGVALKAAAAELDHTLRANLAEALPELVTLKDEDAQTTGADARGPRLVLRIEANTPENASASPASADVQRAAAPGETSAATESLPRTLNASMVWVSPAGSEEGEVTLLSVTANLHADPDARATALAEEAEALAALKSDLRDGLDARMPELLAKLAEVTLAAMQKRRAAVAGDVEAWPGDLEWGWFAVWAEAGLTLPQGDAELAARRALALPESQPVGENR